MLHPPLFAAIPRPCFRPDKASLAPRRHDAERPTLADRHPRRMTRALKRRQLKLDAAALALSDLPGPGEALHWIMGGRYDLAHLIAVLTRQKAPCLHLRVATLSLNRRNLDELLRLYDQGLTGALSLLTSSFFSRMDSEIYQDMVREFGVRKQRVGHAKCHAKVVTWDFGHSGRMSLEGSANLRTNDSLEQCALANDAALHDWHAAWIDDALTTAPDGQEEGTQADETADA